MQSSHKLLLDKAIGDGNCGLNAFILGFCRESVFAELEALNRAPADGSMFVQRAAAIFNTQGNWSAVRKKILALRYSSNIQDRMNLQRLLAPIMRDIAIDQAKQDRAHLERTKQPLLSAFRDNVLVGLALRQETAGVPDDIYKPHPFIQSQFDILYIQLFGGQSGTKIEENAELDGVIAASQHQLLYWWEQPRYMSTFRAYVQAKLCGKEGSYSHLDGQVRDKFNLLYDQVLIDFGDDAASYASLKSSKIRNGEDNERLKNLDSILDAAVNSVQNELNNWFGNARQPLALYSKESGYETFMQEMNHPGKWVGDLELAALAHYFQVNLEVVRPDYRHYMHIECGELPRENLTADQIKQLADRGVINRPQNNGPLTFLPMSHEMVEKRLSAVPEAMNFIVSSHALDLLNTEVPGNFSNECMEQLIKRGVVSSRKIEQAIEIEEGKFEIIALPTHKFTVDVEEAVKRLSEITNKDVILSAWENNYINSPLVTLTNPRAVHWDNMLPANEVEATVLKAPNTATFLDLYSDIMLKLQTHSIRSSSKNWSEFKTDIEARAQAEKENLATLADKTEDQKQLEKQLAEKKDYYFEKSDTPEEVTEYTQIKLDEELAKRLYEEEYEEYEREEQQANRFKIK